MNEVICVTGGTGFIGSHLVEELISRKYTIVVPYMEKDPLSIFSSHNLEKNTTAERCDIRNKEEITRFLQKYNVTYIFHLAAQTLVTTAYKDPFTTLDTNIMGTIHLLEAMREIPSIKGMIFASSDKSYGKTTKAYTEESPLKGDHPYDVSKSAADLIVQTYYKTYGTKVVTTRFGNVYGEGDLHWDRLIPGLCEAIIKNKTFNIRSDGKYVRDYLYVKDVVNGYIMLLSHIDAVMGEAFNFSSSDTLSVTDLIKKIESVLSIKVPYTILNQAKNEIPYQHLDDTKIRKLGWTPKHSIVDTIPSILEWYKHILTQ